MNPIVTMTIENMGSIKIKLFPSEAPETCNNFIHLINDGFYNGLKFWRIEKEGIQGGCLNNRGDGRIGYAIVGEFKENGYENKLPMTRGVVMMARVTPNSASSQFTILREDMPRLGGRYAAFARVLEGMDIVDAIGKTRTYKDGVLNRADEDIVIVSVTVNTFGKEYPEPQKLPELTPEEKAIELKKLLDQKVCEQNNHSK